MKLNFAHTGIATLAVVTSLTILAAAPAQAGPGYALEFNGTNNYVWINRPVSNDFTIEFWFNSTQVAGTNTQWWQGMGMVDGEVAGSANDFGVSLGAGTVVFGTGGSTDTSIRSGPVADGKWHHVAATRVQAKALGVAEQKEEFAPVQGEIVMADVDVEEFSTNTLSLLNLVMLIHAHGINADTVGKLMQSSPPPGQEQQFVDGLFQDLLRLRNRRLLEALKAHLPESEIFIVPWGAAHMPEIAQEIQKLGFHLAETQDYTVLRFRSGAPKPKGVGKARAVEKPN